MEMADRATVARAATTDRYNNLIPHLLVVERRSAVRESKQRLACVETPVWQAGLRNNIRPLQNKLPGSKNAFDDGSR